MKRLLIAAALLSAAACAPRRDDFPVGFFGVNTPAEMRVLAGDGFDAIQSYARDPKDIAALSSAARANGQLLLISPDEVMKAGAKPDFPNTVWYVRDEPDVAGWTGAYLQERDRAVKAWAPKSRTAFVVGDGRKAKDYPGACDAIMEDWYPIPHLAPESSGDMVRRTAEAAGGRKVWAVLQAFDWRGSPQGGDPHKPRIGRFPEAFEIRFMSYDAVVNGAQGVWYFAFSTATGSNLAQTPELFERVTGPAREMRAMAPIFARGRPIPLPFPPDPDGAAARAWTYRGRDYLVLVNRRTGQDVSVPDEILEPTWRPLFEVRRDPRELLREYRGQYYLRQHQVLVLESRLRLSRLLGR